MKTVQMTLDEELVNKLDQIVKKLHTTRSAFTRKALWNAIKHLNTRQLEAKHKKGYKDKPVHKSEFSIWESEQIWGD